MRRVLLWLLVSVAVWEGFVYLYSRPRFWVEIALIGERVCTGALHMYDMSSADQERRAAQWEEINREQRERKGIGSMHTGDTVTDIEAYLRRMRRPWPGA